MKLLVTVNISKGFDSNNILSSLTDIPIIEDSFWMSLLEQYSS